jgi:hypothetical protein
MSELTVKTSFTLLPSDGKYLDELAEANNSNRSKELRHMIVRHRTAAWVAGLTDISPALIAFTVASSRELIRASRESGDRETSSALYGWLGLLDDVALLALDEPNQADALKAAFRAIPNCLREHMHAITA